VKKDGRPFTEHFKDFFHNPMLSYRVIRKAIDFELPILCEKTTAT